MAGAGPEGAVEVAGELDAHAVDRVDVALSRLPPGVRSSVDMARVTFMDSSVLRVLVRHRERLRASGGDLHLHRPSANVRRLLELSGLDTVFGLREAKRP